jgi:hypothetical protein
MFSRSSRANELLLIICAWQNRISTARRFCLSLYTLYTVVGQEAGGLDGPIAGPKRLPVAEDFLGGGIQRVAVSGLPLVKLVVGGDDVLDLRAVLRLLKGEGADEDVLLGDVPMAPFNSAKARSAAATAFRMAVISKRRARGG